MKIGILGGTFDPVHNGHLAIAEQVRALLKLEEVVFVPAGQPWLKTGQSITSAEQRIKMLRLAIAGKPYFRLSAIEIERAGPSYTVDTITQMKAQLGMEDELVFIIGWDKLYELHLWKDLPRLLEACRLAAVPRPGYSLPDLTNLEAAIPGAAQRVELLDMPLMDVSASEIRRRVARGQSISALVPRAVAQYIDQHALYSA